MEGSVSPPVEVDPWKDTGLARNPRVDLVVWQYHCVDLLTIGSWMGLNLICQETGKNQHTALYNAKMEGHLHIINVIRIVAKDC